MIWPAPTVAGQQVAPAKAGVSQQAVRSRCLLRDAIVLNYIRSAKRLSYRRR